MKIIKLNSVNLSDTNYTSDLINEAVNTLKSGGLIIFPTETCYGVGVDARNSNAVTKLLEYKKRPEGKAISIAVDSIHMASEYVEINESAKKIYDTFMPGPVTVVSKSKGKVDKRLESEAGTLGIRIPNYSILLDLISEFGFPITSTSANLSSKPTPYTIEDIFKHLPEKNKELIDLVIDAGELPKNPPSTVIDSSRDDLVVYRKGLINPRNVKSVNKYISNSVTDTIDIASKILKVSKAKEETDNSYNNVKLILLDGELGAGKTHFTKGVAKSLNIERIIKSPTYNYFNEYMGTLNNKEIKLIHFDGWKIQSIEDLKLLGFYNWFNKDNIVVIEWASIIFNLDEEFFNNLNYLHIELNVLSETAREIRVYNVVNK